MQNGAAMPKYGVHIPEQDLSQLGRRNLTAPSRYHWWPQGNQETVPTGYHRWKVGYVIEGGAAWGEPSSGLL